MTAANNEFVTPIGRLVQGSMTLSDKVDMKTNKPVIDTDTGKVVQDAFFAVAFPKMVKDPQTGQMVTNAEFNAWYGQLAACAAAEFPHLFNAQGQCTHPRFAWKLQDGDGVDSNGKSVATKEGFAGHWIVKFGSRYAPRCFRANQYDPSQQLQNPDEVIKRGYFVRVGGNFRGNGVKPTDGQNVPGMFLSGNLVEFVAFGPEIVSGPDAGAVFGQRPMGALPPGASAAPVGGAPAPLGAAPLPGAVLPPPALPGVALPGMPAAAPLALPGVAPAPLPLPPVAPVPLPPAPVAAGPTYQMTALAGGNAREAYLAGGWTDEALLTNGYMVRVS